MVILGGLTLNHNMIWTDRYSSQTVEQTTKRTLTGRLVVFSAGLTAGLSITLVAQEDAGWLTKAQVDALLVMAAVPGAIYQLTYGSDTYNVMFKNDSPPAVEFKPIIYRMAAQDGDYLIGTIKLITV